MITKSIHEFKPVMEALDINPNDLGCVMLPVEPFDLFGEGRGALLSTEDLYVSDDPAKFWINGDVSEKAHITLLYGLLTPAYEQKELVNAVLEGWDRPEWLAPENITFFPSRDTNEPDYAAIVVEVENPALDEAHSRLSYLPHVNTFPYYRAHLTLAYVKLSAAQEWMDVLNGAQFHIYVTDGLDYGEDK